MEEKKICVKFQTLFIIILLYWNPRKIQSRIRKVFEKSFSEYDYIKGFTVFSFVEKNQCSITWDLSSLWKFFDCSNKTNDAWMKKNKKDRQTDSFCERERRVEYKNTEINEGRIFCFHCISILRTFLLILVCENIYARLCVKINDCVLAFM